jgi:hypothetical protein
MTDSPKVPVAEDLQELHHMAISEDAAICVWRDGVWICEGDCSHAWWHDLDKLIERTSRAEAALEVVEQERTALENICQYGVDDGSPDRMLRDHRRYESWCLHQAQNPDQSEQAKWVGLACDARAFIKQYGGLDAQENLIDRCKKAEAALEALQQENARLKAEGEAK